jgi:thiol-disulfide isomerase/thioredoxin
MRRLLPALLLMLLGAACGRAPEASSTPDTVPSTEDSAATAALDPPRADLRVATSDEVLAFVRDGAAPLTVVNFWATWCAPCIVEFPELVRMGAEMGPDSVRLVFVSADDLSDSTSVQAFLDRQDATGVAFQKNEPDEPFISAFSKTWTGTLPATFVYDRSGREVAFFDRPVTFETITDTLRGLLRSSLP